MRGGLRARVEGGVPHRALMAFREAAAWTSVVRLLGSRNKLFIRFAPPGHYYSPLPDLASVRRHAARVFGAEASAGDLPGIDLREEEQLHLLEVLGGVTDRMPFPDVPTDGFRFHLDNEYFGYADAAVLFSMLMTCRPRRIVEVGSGYSSAAMLDIDDRFFGGTLDLTFIEPYPDRLRGLLADSDPARCTIVESPVQDVDPAVFAQLQAGDVLFIDSSHVAKMDSDVLHLLFRVLPSLADGVVVHVHDIPWPFEYPQRWLEQGKAWNEAYLLRAFLMYNSAFQILFHGPFLAARHPEALRAALPAVRRTPSAPGMVTNSSLWLRKEGDGSRATEPVSG